MTESEPQLVSDFNAPLKGGRKTKKHGKRHGNASLRAWVTFVKKVAKEEKLSYRDAMMRAKARKDKGEKWMKGGDTPDNDVMTGAPGDSMEVVEEEFIPMKKEITPVEEEFIPMEEEITPVEEEIIPVGVAPSGMNELQEGGRRRRRHGRKTHRKKSHKKRRSTKKRRGSRRR